MLDFQNDLHQAPPRCARLAVLVAFWSALPGLAHEAPAVGILPIVDGGALVGGGTTWGLYARLVEGVDADQPGFASVCEEALGGAIRFYARPPAARGPDTLWVGTAGGVVLTTDGGCTVDAVSGLAGENVVAALTRGARAYALTSSTPGPDDPGNGLYIGDGDGDGFVPFALFPDHFFSHLSVADDGTALLAGFRRDGAGIVHVLLSVDESGAVKDVAPALLAAADLPPPSQLKVVGSDDDRHFVVHLNDRRQSTLLEVQPAAAAAADLAPVVEVLGTDARDITRAVRFRDRVFVQLNSNALAVVDEAGFRAVDGGPTHCLYADLGDDRLWGCGQTRHGAFFLVSDDGETFTPELPIPSPTQESRRACPARSSAPFVCGGAVDPVDPVYPVDPVDPVDPVEPVDPAEPTAPTPSSSPPGSCGGAPGLAGVILSFGLLGRRRSRSRAPSAGPA